MYPVLIRQEWHGHHDYRLRVADNIEIGLTEQQVLSLRDQIDQDQKTPNLPDGMCPDCYCIGFHAKGCKFT